MLTLRLHPDWRRILARAWSVRLILLAGVLTVAEGVLSAFSDGSPLLTWAAATATGAAFVARIVAQENLSDDA